MSKSILLVEDDFDILNLISLSLEREGFAVAKATNYKEALREIEHNSDFDVVLMDYYLPEVDGVSLAKIISEKNYKVPVILFTAAELEHIKQNFPENIVDTIKKPFSIDEVIDKISKTIKLKQFVLSNSNRHLPEAEKTFNTNINMTDLIYTEKAESLKVLLSRLSHDIKNALQTISTNIELLEKGYVDEADKGRCFQSIKRKIDEIRKDLDVLKHPQEFQKEEAFSLKNCIRDVLRELKKEIKEKDVYIKTDFVKKLPLYHGKKGVFHVMVKDILATLLACIPMSEKIEISLANHQQEFFLEIYQSAIFQECDNSLKFFDMHYGGDGLGLARAILQLKEMKGKIDLSLLETGGINVKISFPMR